MNRTEETLQAELQKVISNEMPARISTLSQGDFNGASEPFSTLGSDLSGLSTLQELICKVDECLERQQQVHFITKEIAEIVKRSS